MSEVGDYSFDSRNGYKCNLNYCKKALMCLGHIEQMDGCRIMHDRNGREYKLPELPNFSLDRCAETRTVYAFFGCFWHGCPCQPFRDLSTMSVSNRTDDANILSGPSAMGM